MEAEMEIQWKRVVLEARNFAVDVVHFAILNHILLLRSIYKIIGHIGSRFLVLGIRV